MQCSVVKTSMSTWMSLAVGVGVDEYVTIVESFTQELMQIVPFLTEDKSQMLVGVSGFFFVHCRRSSSYVVGE